MKTPRRPTIDERVAEAAATWFVRLQAETATGEDWLAFETWLAADPAHVEAYNTVESLSAELDEKAGALAAVPDAPRAARRRNLPLRPHGRLARRLWIAVGGTVAASLALAIVLFERSPGPAPAALYAAAAGETREVRLADGTQVRLNAASSLNVRFDRDARRVQMADAEAAFDVTHDPQRPFLITVGDTQVRVVGTEFNIRHRNGDTELTVRRGLVEVRPGGADAQPYRVAAGQLFAHRDGAPTAAITQVNASDAFAWTSGQLVYRDRPLSQVAADLSRRFGRPIATDARSGTIRFTGVLVTDSEPAVLRRLESFAPVKAVQTADGVVIRAR